MTMTSHSNAMHHGFTLIEVLISILIVAIGLTGAMKLQIASMQAVQQSMYFRAATAFAADMSDKTTGNPDRQLHAAGNPYLKVNFQAGLNQIASAPSCFQNQCTARQLAAADIAEWLSAVDAALPNAHAVICQDDLAWSASTDNFAWDCHGGSERSAIVIKIGWADKNELRQIAVPRLVMPAYRYVE